MYVILGLALAFQSGDNVNKITDLALDLGVFALDKELESGTGRAQRAAERLLQRLSLTVEFQRKSQQVTKWMTDMRLLRRTKPRSTLRCRTADREDWSIEKTV